MKKVNRKNKIGVTLLSILLITSLVAIVSLTISIVCGVKIHNLKEQVVELQTELSIQEEQLLANNKIEVTPLVEAQPVKNEPADTLTYIGEFKITGYDAKCNHCCGKSDGITASMTKAKSGRTVAMNRTDMKKLGIEYGDTIYIDGIGDRIVEDTGCGQGVIDVVMANHDECYKITGNYNVFVRERT